MNTARVRRARAQRGDILERAAQLMAVKGFAGMSARDLAAELEFSKANLFYHVRSKEELLYQIIVHTMESFIRRVEEILRRRDSPEARLRALIDFYVHVIIERSAVMLVWFKERGHLSRPHAARVQQLETRLLALVHRFYAGAIRRGDFQPVTPLVARLTIFGMCFTAVNFDLFNVANANAVLTENLTFGPVWRQPLSILGARLAKLSVNLDF